MEVWHPCLAVNREFALVDEAHEISGKDSGPPDLILFLSQTKGAGVTIALLESATPEFTHPTLRSAKALDGTDIGKIAGECFYWDYAGPASQLQVVTVRQPKAGKWVLAVNAAPSMIGQGGFVVEELLGGRAVRQMLVSSPKSSTASRWTTTVEKPSSIKREDNKVPILICELVDAALERAEMERQVLDIAANGESKEKPTPKPVAGASCVYELK